MEEIANPEISQSIVVPPSSGNWWKIGILMVGLVLAGSIVYAGWQFSQKQTVVYQPTPTPVVQPSPTPTTDPTANWKTAKSIIGLEFKYPTDWYLEESGSTQFPNVRVQNYPFQKLGGGAYNKGDFYFIIQRYVVGNENVSKTEQLIGRLPKAGDSFMYIGSSETFSLYQQETVKIGPYESLHRIYGPAANPSVKEEIYYILGNKGNVLQVELKMDIESQRRIFDQILSTFKFTE